MPSIASWIPHSPPPPPPSPPFPPLPPPSPSLPPSFIAALPPAPAAVSCASGERRRRRGAGRDRTGIFAGDDPFAIARAWLAEAERTEPNDPNAMALATVGDGGLPNVRMVLLKEIEPAAFVFYTNYESVKAREIDAAGAAAFVMHWKSLRRQIRARGTVTREDGPQADAYYRSRSLPSRLGAWASAQSRPLASRAALMLEVAKVAARRASTRRGRRSGAATGSCRWRSSSGPTGRTACTTASAGRGPGRTRPGRSCA